MDKFLLITIVGIFAYAAVVYGVMWYVTEWYLR